MVVSLPGRSARGLAQPALGGHDCADVGLMFRQAPELGSNQAFSSMETTAENSPTPVAQIDWLKFRTTVLTAAPARSRRGRRRQAAADGQHRANDPQQRVNFDERPGKASKNRSKRAVRR